MRIMNWELGIKLNRRHSLFMIHYSGRNNGFTLIELLIYVVVIGGVATAFISYILSVSQARNKTYVVEEVQANGRLAMEIISQRIRAASGVNLGGSVFDTHPGRLSLVMSDAQKNPTVIDVDANGALQVMEGLQPAIPITGTKVRVTNLVFTNLSGSSSRENIRVELTIAYGVSAGGAAYSYSQSLRTTVSVRQ